MNLLHLFQFYIWCCLSLNLWLMFMKTIWIGSEEIIHLFGVKGTWIAIAGYLGFFIGYRVERFSFATFSYNKLRYKVKKNQKKWKMMLIIQKWQWFLDSLLFYICTISSFVRKKSCLHFNRGFNWKRWFIRISKNVRSIIHVQLLPCWCMDAVFCLWEE